MAVDDKRKCIVCIFNKICTRNINCLIDKDILYQPVKIIKITKFFAWSLTPRGKRERESKKHLPQAV